MQTLSFLSSIEVLKEWTTLVNARNGQLYKLTVFGAISAVYFRPLVQLQQFTKGMKGVPYSNLCENCITVYQNDENQLSRLITSHLEKRNPSLVGRMLSDW